MTSRDAFSIFDDILRGLDLEDTPWSSLGYGTELDVLRELLAIPIGLGEKQESGRVAKALDAWVAHELRRAGFPPEEVWPRLGRPRVLPEGLAPLAEKIANLGALLSSHEAAQGSRLKPPELRRAIKAVLEKTPGSHEAYILGDFYAKQIDVGLSSWRRGPDLLISTKTMFSAYRKNLRNRHEEAVGEASSLRRRHPMAAMGYVYLVRKNIYDEEGAYASLYDILSRLERPGEMFDATMLLVVDWDESVPPNVMSIDQPADDLSSGRFFEKMIAAVTSRTPVTEHQLVRLWRDGAPEGGLPDPDVDEDEAAAINEHALTREHEERLDG